MDFTIWIDAEGDLLEGSEQFADFFGDGKSLLSAAINQFNEEEAAANINWRSSQGPQDASALMAPGANINKGAELVATTTWDLHHHVFITWLPSMATPPEVERLVT